MNYRVCFNSLQTGKCIQRQRKFLTECKVLSFNSLQTGKCIQSENFFSLDATFTKFQFPSNGKVYPKAAVREVLPKSADIGFNSLQTGKCIQRVPQAAINTVAISFNSLQTGKCIQRDPILSPVGPWLRNAKTKREVHGAFFNFKIYPKNPANPRVH